MCFKEVLVNGSRVIRQRSLFTEGAASFLPVAGIALRSLASLVWRLCRYRRIGLLGRLCRFGSYTLFLRTFQFACAFTSRFLSTLSGKPFTSCVFGTLDSQLLSASLFGGLLLWLAQTRYRGARLQLAAHL
jgi:hypothetical protein